MAGVQVLDRSDRALFQRVGGVEPGARIGKDHQNDEKREEKRAAWSTPLQTQIRPLKH